MKSQEQRDSPRSPGELNLHRPPRPAQPRAHGQGGCSERNWGEGKGRAGIVVSVGTVAERTIRSLAVFFLEGRRPGRRRKAQELGVVVSSSCLPAFSSCQRARAWGSPALPSAKAGVYFTLLPAPTKTKQNKTGMSCPGKRAWREKKGWKSQTRVLFTDSVLTNIQAHNKGARVEGRLRVGGKSSRWPVAVKTTGVPSPTLHSICEPGPQREVPSSLQ